MWRIETGTHKASLSQHFLQRDKGDFAVSQPLHTVVHGSWNTATEYKKGERTL